MRLSASRTAETRSAAPLGAADQQSPQFGIGNYAQIFGVASPLLWTTANNISIDGLYLAVGGAGTNNVNTQNGQYGLIIQGGKTTVSNCFGDAGLSGTSVPLIFNSNADGACAWYRLRTISPLRHQFGTTQFRVSTSTARLLVDC